MENSIDDRALMSARRTLLLGSAAAMAAIGLSQPAGAAANAPTSKGPGRPGKSLRNTTNELVTKDGTKIFYKDWGDGQPITFSHGWPLTADAWDAQMVFLGEHGFRVIAHDRRGHGRSSQTWAGNDMDTYADDLAAVMDHLDLKNTMMVGHSTGGGEVVRYLGRHGSGRVAKIVLVGAIPPQMVMTSNNPNGAPMEVFDGLRSGLRSERSEFFKGLSAPFFGTNLPNAKPLQRLRDLFWLQGMMGGQKSLLDCIKAFSETDFHADLQKIDVPTLLIHGESDQIVPIQISSDLTAKLVKGATLKVYPGAPHGLTFTHQEIFNQDLLAFVKI